MLRSLAPHGLVRLTDWAGRFRAVGVSRQGAWRMALSPASRNNLVESRIEWLWPLLRRRKMGLLVDVGANRGQWLSAILQFVMPERVVAFEPDPQPFAELQAWAGTRPNVELYPMGLGETAGQVAFHATTDSLFSSVLTPRSELGSEYGAGRLAPRDRFSVKLVTLDEMVPEDQIDLLKLDVQGFERFVLAGARRCLQRTRLLLIETNLVSHYEGDDTFKELSTLLVESYGLEFWTLAPPFYGSGKRALWSDAIFRNPSLTLASAETGESQRGFPTR